MHHHRSSIGFQLYFEFEDDHGNKLFMLAFSSNKFMKLILTGKLKPNILLQQLQYTNEFIDIMDAVSSVVSYINTNGCFTVIGWYKIDVITDKMLVS